MDVVVLFILHKIFPVASHIITHVNYFNCSVSCDFSSATYNKASQAIQSPRTVPFFLLVSLLDGYSFPNVIVKGVIAFKH